jgi:tetratricopeptide (TPR) repeat protein
MAAERQKRALNGLEDLLRDTDEMSGDTSGLLETPLVITANLLAMDGRREAALVAWDKAIAASTEPQAEHFSSRGQLHAQLGHFDEAFDDCSYAIELAPRLGRPHAVRAVARGHLGHSEEDIQSDFDRAIELSPEDWLCLFYRARFHDENARFEEAVADYDRAIAQRPGVAMLYAERGSSRARMDDDGDPEKGIDDCLADFDKALELGHRGEHCYSDKATLLQQRGDLAGAIAVLDEGIGEIQSGYLLYWRHRYKKSLGDTEGAAADRVRAEELGFQSGED